MKMIFKEIIITLLVCIAILLILSIIFYSYNPLNKVIPSEIAYTTPQEVKNQIGEGEVKDILDESYNVVYSITDSDLNKYKKSNRYVPGKEHPFSSIESSEGDTIEDTGDVNEITTNEVIGNTTNTFLNRTGK